VPEPSRIAVGAAAETRAAEYLSQRGLTVMARNLRCKAGELDLVCVDGETLVIVEVRQRARGDFGGASASVTRNKRVKLLRAARFFWQRRPDWRHRIMRFDVIAITGDATGSGPIEWLKDAFRATT